MAPRMACQRSVSYGPSFYQVNWRIPAPPKTLSVVSFLGRAWKFVGPIARSLTLIRNEVQFTDARPCARWTDSDWDLQAAIIEPYGCLSDCR